MRRAFWLTLSAVLLAVSYWATSSGTMGGWDIHIMGVRHQAVWDPGGPYLGSGLLLFRQPFAPFVGHPGLTLTLLCHVVAKAMYLPFAAATPFDEFAARHIYAIAFTASLCMTGVFVAALATVERVALRLLGDYRMAMLAVVAYATTLPVLLYLNKISSEPLLVLFTLLTFLWLWRYYEAANRQEALTFLALSAQASVAAVYTKALIVAPILAFIPLHLVCHRGAPLRWRIRDAALYVAFCIPGLALGALKTDWAYFFRFWFAYAPGGPQYSGSRHWLVNVVMNASKTLPAMVGSAASQLAPQKLVPSFDTREGLFIAAEGLFLVLGAVGLVLYRRACRNRPALLDWFLVFLALTAIPYLQKGLSAWHYLFVHFAVASVFVAYAIARLVRRVAGMNLGTAGGWALGCCVALAVNGVGAYLFVDARRYDARQHVAWELYYRAPSMIGPDGRIGLVHTAHVDEILQPIAAYLPLEGFLAKYRDYLVPISGAETRAELSRRHIEAIVELTPTGLVFQRVDER